MKVEDTVLGTTQDAVWDFEKFKLDQAEISFKAGREYEHKIMIGVAVDEGNKAFKDGRRSVVKCIREYGVGYALSEANLKEWGVEC